MRTAYITGRLGKDPETFAPQGSEYSVLKFSVANNDESKKAQDGSWDNVVNWFDCEYWTKKPQPWLQKLAKGVEVCLECTIKQDTWEKDGQKRSKIKFVVNRFPVVVGARTEPAKQESPVGPEQFDDDSEDIPF
jgi:single-strand DNA-binding protein